VIFDGEAWNSRRWDSYDLVRGQAGDDERVSMRGCGLSEEGDGELRGDSGSPQDLLDP